MAHFYLDESLEPRVGASVELRGAEARHAVTVSRVAVGDRILVGTGAGVTASGLVEAAEPARLTIAVDRVEEHPRRRPAIVLAQALAKGDRDELAVQAATELGVDIVIPWQASRSVSRWEGAKVAKGRDRWAAIVREATKQSMRPWLPDVLEPATTAGLARLAAEARVLVLDPTADVPLGQVRDDGRDVVVVVGPEGGIAPAERETLLAAGAEAVRLGPEVLRTSTAGPAAIAVLSVALGRWDGAGPRG